MKKTIAIFLTACILFGCMPAKMNQINDEAGKLQAQLSVLVLLYDDLYQEVLAKKHEILPGDWKKLVSIDVDLRRRYAFFRDSLGNIQSTTMDPAMDPDLIANAILQLTPIVVDILKNRSPERGK